MTKTYATIVFGLGQIGVGYAQDPLTSYYYPYATHAQVLRDHPAFNWIAAVDLDWMRCSLVQEQWQVSQVSTTLDNIPDRENIEVAILATPPGNRLELIASLPNLKAIIAEKPLGIELAEAENFVRVCRERDILLQVNLWRRADKTFRNLAGGQLTSEIGRIQAAHIIYGNGFLNNGTHAIDFLRMLLGDIAWVQATLSPEAKQLLPIAGDVNLSGFVGLRCGAIATLNTLNFQNYREFCFDIWGDLGKLSILNEGLNVQVIPCAPHRAISGQLELRYEDVHFLETTVGHALYGLYDNLVDSLSGKDYLWSSGQSALITTQVVNAFWQSSQAEGVRISP